MRAGDSGPGYFNPRAPYGARLSRAAIKSPPSAFQSTRPIRSATPWLCCLVSFTFYFNPRAPYGARRSGVSPVGPAIGISIHAPHTERDCFALVIRLIKGISIHAPHTERDHKTNYNIRPGISISIHAPHTERDVVPAFAVSAVPDISIHAPHTERDFLRRILSRGISIFQSTRPIRSATLK